MLFYAKNRTAPIPISPRAKTITIEPLFVFMLVGLGVEEICGTVGVVSIGRSSFSTNGILKNFDTGPSLLNSVSGGNLSNV